MIDKELVKEISVLETRKESNRLSVSDRRMERGGVINSSVVDSIE